MSLCLLDNKYITHISTISFFRTEEETILLLWFKTYRQYSKRPRWTVKQSIFSGACITPSPTLQGCKKRFPGTLAGRRLPQAVLSHKTTTRRMIFLFPFPIIWLFLFACHTQSYQMKHSFLSFSYQGGNSYNSECWPEAGAFSGDCSVSGVSFMNHLDIFFFLIMVLN